ncbi:ROK family protein [Agromyces mediolanus]|uniref:ROK family protein n=1 Tax=Agromyces mediolanus TaxID=41986 RepID=UPI001E3E9F29|nr:ROK family protein [Agromyces mediolanus]MCD1570566.1 ROK family protein [Agromyces mediolanus]
MNLLFGGGELLLRQAGDQGRLRRLNSLAVLESVRDDALTIPQIAAVTGLSKTAADSVVSGLHDLGWVTVVEPLTASGAGRPAQRYRFNAAAAVVVGIDIGRHTSRAEIADLAGEVLASGEVPTSREDAPDELLTTVVGLVDELLAELRLDRTSVWAGGASIPAVVYHQTITSGPEKWTGFDLRAGFEQRFRCVFATENDSTLAAFAEAWKGSATAVGSLVYVHSGNRTGSGLVVDGSLFRGSSGAAGEIGALHVLGWETAQEHLKDVVSADGALLQRGEVFDAARRGDERAAAAVDAFAAALAPGIAALILTIDPELVVVGGGNVRAGETFLAPLRQHVAELCTVRPAPPLVASRLADRAPLTGAVGLAIASVLERLYSITSGGGAMPRTTVPPWEWQEAASR